MRGLKKSLIIALSLAVCTIPINASLVFAETTTTTATTSTETTGTTTGTTATDTTGTTTGTTSTDTSGTTGTVQDQNGQVVSPGTLPDSPFYWFTTLIEKIQLALTFDPAKKTELLENQALENMSEAQAMLTKENPEKAAEALQAYTEKIAKAQDFLAQVSDPTSETAQKLQTALTQTHANNIQTLVGLLDKLPPQAAEKVALNVVHSMEKDMLKMDKTEKEKVGSSLKKTMEKLKTDNKSEEDKDALKDAEESLIETAGTQGTQDTQDTQVTSALTAKTAAASTVNTVAPVEKGSGVAEVRKNIPQKTAVTQDSTSVGAVAEPEDQPSLNQQKDKEIEPQEVEPQKVEPQKIEPQKEMTPNQESDQNKNRVQSPEKKSTPELRGRENNKGEQKEEGEKDD